MQNVQKLMQRKREKKNKGFTLIELIVVIAIIGILMAIAIPRLIGYTETAREASDDQLAALYKNTFSVLVGSGKAVTGTLSSDVYAPATGEDNCIITVDATGAIALDSAGASLIQADADGTYVAYTQTMLEELQKEFIAKGGVRGAAAVPNFRSKVYTQDGANGITIIITPQGDVSVKVTTTGGDAQEPTPV